MRTHCGAGKEEVNRALRCGMTGTERAPATTGEDAPLIAAVTAWTICGIALAMAAETMPEIMASKLEETDSMTFAVIEAIIASVSILAAEVASGCLGAFDCVERPVGGSFFTGGLGR